MGHTHARQSYPCFRSRLPMSAGTCPRSPATSCEAAAARHPRHSLEQTVSAAAARTPFKVPARDAHTLPNNAP
eukprot:6179089-Pleurochrysis_carterae.AAC.3